MDYSRGTFGYILGLCLVVFLCSCSEQIEPSENDIQTAIAKTQESNNSKLHDPSPTIHTDTPSPLPPTATATLQIPTEEPLSTTDVNVERHIMQCYESRNSNTLAEYYWGYWKLHHENGNYWADVDANIYVRGGDGRIINDYSVFDTHVIPNQPEFSVAVTAFSAGVFEGGGSRINDIEYEIDDVVWKPYSFKDNEYDVGSTINILRLEKERGVSRPRHALYILVINPTDYEFTDIHGFAAVKDSQGRLIDLLWIWNDYQIPYNQAKEIIFGSMSQSGSCVGFPDSAGKYLVDIWVTILGDERNAPYYFENVEFTVP